MSHELTLRIPHRAAARLAQAIGMVLRFTGSPEERVYFQSLHKQVQDFAGTQPPTYVKVTVVARDGVPVEGPFTNK